MPRGRPSYQPTVALNKDVLTEVSRQHGRLSLVDNIFEMVVAQIRAGRLAAGHRLHSVRQLSDACEISRDTVARAYDKLVAHGHLESRPGSGFFVRTSGREARISLENIAAPPLPEWWRFRLLQSASGLTSTTGLGALPQEWLDDSGLGKAIRAVARASVRNLMGYNDPLGYLPLRQQLQSKLRDIQIDAPVGRIMVTGGATHALNLLVAANLRTPGESVLVEDPSSFLIRDRLMASGLGIMTVPRNADGPNLEALRERCIRHRPRFFFCSSVLHSPTSGYISPHKAYQILRLAEEFDLTIVEDDTYSDLMPVATTTGVTRLASLDQLERVIYVGSFSKTIAPGLRIGYVCANQKVIDWLNNFRVVTEIAGAAINERVAYQLLSQGGYRHHCAQLRSRLDECRQPVIDRLTAVGCTLENRPESGMYVWATLPSGANALELADELLKAGHLMAPGGLFSGSPAHASKMRFNISRTLDSPVIGELSRLLTGRMGV